MEATGFVLAGGGSTRMGRDKALLPYRGATLIESVARAVEQAAGSATLIGDPQRYGDFGFPVYADRVASCGPMGGIYTALSVTSSDWNLIVACDMPMLTAPALKSLIEKGRGSTKLCVVASGTGGEPQPLCGVYHRRCLPMVEQAIRDKRFTMKKLLSELNAELFAFDEPVLANVNTPTEWVPFESEPE